jgi:hypothetical protein
MAELKLVIAPAMSWEYILKFNQSPPEETFPRSETIIKEYQQHKTNVISKYNNISQYITCKYFSNSNAAKFFRLVPNEFPYLLEDGIKHLVCWFNPFVFPNKSPDLNTIPDQIKVIMKLYNSKLTLGKDWIYFENNTTARSVPGIRHIHIFIKE